MVVACRKSDRPGCRPMQPFVAAVFGIVFVRLRTLIDEALIRGSNLTLPNL
jgi:hypothetical protein